MLVFKEWAYVVEALASSRQNIILRKGGIAEDEGDFALRNTEFLLMPTAFHQASELIKEDWYYQNKDKIYVPDNQTVKLEYKAIVIKHEIINSEEELLKLNHLHVWKESVVLERFHRWQQNTVHCLYVEIEKLTSPIILEMLPEYGGCKSWIEI